MSFVISWFKLVPTLCSHISKRANVNFQIYRLGLNYHLTCNLATIIVDSYSNTYRSVILNITNTLTAANHIVVGLLVFNKRVFDLNRKHESDITHIKDRYWSVTLSKGRPIWFLNGGHWQQDKTDLKWKQKLFTPTPTKHISTDPPFKHLLVHLTSLLWSSLKHLIVQP